jgi:uncharacterized protein (DUF2249 family)
MRDASEASGQSDTLDVRAMPPALRHPTIFQCFEALPTGGSFTLVNDHDPKPLYYQLSFEYSRQLGWDYLEQGPVVWRVRISRTAASSSPKGLPVRRATEGAQ